MNLASTFTNRGGFGTGLAYCLSVQMMDKSRYIHTTLLLWLEMHCRSSFSFGQTKMLLS